MTILQNYMTGDVGRALGLLSDSEIAGLETRVSERAGKLYVHCLKRNKDVRVTPEEVVRQLWLDRLTAQYGYPLSRIRVEDAVVIGRDATKKADIVITDEQRPDALYAVIEVKQVKANHPYAPAQLLSAALARIYSAASSKQYIGCEICCCMAS
jgi:type I restriction enzyme M protein